MNALVDLTMSLSRLPGIGSKSAKRIAYFLLEEPPLAQQLIENLSQLSSAIYVCPICAAYSEESSCQYCQKYRKDPHLLCIVEKPTDVMVIEASGAYGGYYHVLGGALSPMDGIGPDQLRLAELKLRLEENKAISEVVIATNLNLEGDATASYLERWLQSFEVKITRIASGLSVGTYLEYADKESLARSLSGRNKF